MYKRKREDSIDEQTTDITFPNKFKYLYQKCDYYSYHCGPFALYNLLINYNKHIGLNKLIKLCNPDPINGTNNKQMEKTVCYLNKKFDINIKTIKPTIVNIKSILESGGKIIILFHWTHYFHKGEHYSMIENMISPHKFKFINYSFDEPNKIVSLRELKNMLRSYNINDDTCPTIWYLDI